MLYSPRYAGLVGAGRCCAERAESYLFNIGPVSFLRRMVLIRSPNRHVGLCRVRLV